MLYYGRVGLLERCTMQSESKTEAVTLMTPEEVAERLKVSIFTVRRWIHQGELPAYRIGRSWRIGPTDLDQWLETHRQPNEPEPAQPSQPAPLR